MSERFSHDQPDARNDNAEPVAAGGLARDLLMALRFYSRLPTGPSPHEVPDLSRMAMALPFASALIGLAPAGLFLALLGIGLPALFCALAALGLKVVVTGAMSEDALGDAADGLFGGATRERRLDILKDSRLGSYGVLAIVFLVMATAGVLAELAARGALAAALVWLAAGIWSRSAALGLTLALPPARVSGASAAAGRVGRAGFWIGMVFAALFVLVLSGPFVGLIGLAAAGIVSFAVMVGWTRLCDRKIGGQTGDLIGALQALLEIAMLSAFMGLMTAST